jgi:hypothetical protein
VGGEGFRLATIFLQTDWPKLPAKWKTESAPARVTARLDE